MRYAYVVFVVLCLPEFSRRATSQGHFGIQRRLLEENGTSSDSSEKDSEENANPGTGNAGKKSNVCDKVKGRCCDCSDAKGGAVVFCNRPCPEGFLYTLPKHIKRLALQGNENIKLDKLLFEGMDYLQDLNLDATNIMSLDFSVFSPLTNLKKLSLKRNLIPKLPDTSEQFPELTKLEELYLDNNRITTLDFAVFSPLRNLKVLDLRRNRIALITSTSLTNTGHLKLETINLSKNLITSVDFAIFSAFRMLKVLSLAENNIDSIMSTSPMNNQLQKLETLNLENNNITIIDRNVFRGRMPKFKNLNLRNNPVCSCDWLRVFALVKQIGITAVCGRDTAKSDCDNGKTPSTTTSPGNGNNPSTSSDSGKGNKPSTTISPANGNNPSTSSSPGSGNNPSTTRSPGIGNNPSTTSSPGSGNNPSTTRSPGIGNNPSTTSSPGSGNNPSTTRGPGSGNNPSTTRSPGKGNNPSTTSSPGSGNNPSTTRSPGKGNNPSTTRRPGSGNNPSTTRSPGKGNNPSTTSSPGSGNNPSTTRSPGSGNNPSTTRSPGKENNPSTTSSPGSGNNPSTTFSPGNGNNPSTTRSPGKGNNPSTTSSPGKGNNPSTTSSPGSGNNPSTTSIPGSGNKPSTTRSPGKGNNPSTTSSPGSGNKPSTTSSPGKGNNPSTTSSPGSGNNPSTTRSPGKGNNPSTTSSPGSGNNPSTTSSPGKGNNPSTTSSPGNGTNPGSECTALLQTPECARCVINGGPKIICNGSRLTAVPMLLPRNTTSLSLQGNNITLTRSSFTKLTLVEELILDENNIRSIDSYVFEPLVQLKSLHLDSNLLSEVDFSVFKHLNGLTSLYLRYNRITRLKTSEQNTELPALRYLYLDGNEITSLRATDFPRLPQLSRLFVTENRLLCDCETVRFSFGKGRFSRVDITGVPCEEESRDIDNCPDTSDIGRELNDILQRNITEENAMLISKRVLTLSERSAEFSAEDIHNTVSIIEDLLRISMYSEDREILNNTVSVLSNMFRVPKNSLVGAQRGFNAAQRYVDAIEGFVGGVKLTDSDIESVYPNLAIVVRPLEQRRTNNNITLVASRVLSESGGVMFTDNVPDSAGSDVLKDAIALPSTLFSNIQLAKENGREEGLPSGDRASFILYNNDTFFQAIREAQTRPNVDSDHSSGGSVSDSSLRSDDRPDQEKQVNSRVFSVSIGDLNITNLQDPVALTFRHHSKNSSNPRCVFWDVAARNGMGDWSGEGCQVKESVNGSHTVCECNHLTNFALLMDVYGSGNVATGEEAHISTILSFTGCSISLLGLLLTITVYCLFSNFRRDTPSKILLNLCVALACVNVSFIIGIFALDHPQLCKAVAVLVHYFLLSAMAWMSVEAFYMYMALVIVFKTYFHRFLLKTMLIAWGVPLVIVALTLGINNTDNYGLQADGTICWLDRTAFYIAFLTPVALVLIGNCITFTLVIRQICGRSSKKLNKSETSSATQQLRGIIGVFILLGLTWLFAFFAIGEATPAFQYLFTIFNSLQGLFIFIFYCLMKKDIQKKLFCCDSQGFPTSSSQKSTRGTYSTFASTRLRLKSVTSVLSDKFKRKRDSNASYGSDVSGSRSPTTLGSRSSAV